MGTILIGVALLLLAGFMAGVWYVSKDLTETE